MLSCAPSRTRTYGLLLRKHFQSVAGRCQVWPDVPFRRSKNGWTWPGVALCLRSLASSLAPRSIVSSANLRMIRTQFGAQAQVSQVSPVKRPAR
jgi:hypothetical protein